MTSIPTTSQRTIEEMETWEICHDAIPRGESDEVAKLLRRRGVACNGQTVRSWRNDPDVNEDSDTDPIGRRNPLDDFLDFLNAVGARSAEGAAMITKRIVHEEAKIQADHGREEMLKDREAIKKARQKAQEFLSITEAFGDG